MYSRPSHKRKSERDVCALLLIIVYGCTQVNLKISEDIWSLPKIAEAETALTFPSLRLRTCIAKCDLTPRVFFFIWRRKYCHLHIVFISYIRLSLHIFGNCVKQSSNQSHFSIRCENLACKHKPAWHWHFQSAGVRLKSNVWELVGIS